MRSQKYMSRLQCSRVQAYSSGNSVHVNTGGRVAMRITRPFQSRSRTVRRAGSGSAAARCATRAPKAASRVTAIPPP